MEMPRKSVNRGVFNMGKLHAWISFMAILLLSSCWCGCAGVRFREDSEWHGYCRSENELAREKGFHISIGVEDGAIFYARARHSFDSLKQRILAEVASAELTTNEMSRAPVFIQTRSPVKYGQIAEILDFCAGIGFRVMGILICTSPPKGAKQTTDSCVANVLPSFVHGKRLGEIDRFENVVCADIAKDGTMRLEGLPVLFAEIDSDGNREKIRKIVEGRFSGKTKPYCVIRADVDTDIWHVMRAAELLSFRSFVILQGKSPCAQGADVSNGHGEVGVAVGIPRPDPYFWGTDDVWE